MIKQVLKKLALFFGFVFFLFSLGVAYAYHQYPEARLQIKILQKKLKIQAATEKLIADHTCSNAVKKADCFANFVTVTGGIEFAGDLELFSLASYRVCYSNVECVIANNGKILPLLNLKNLWVLHSLAEDPDFLSETLKAEKLVADRYLRSIRQVASDKFQIETDEHRKLSLLEHVKEIDAKIVEVAQAQ